MIVGAVVLDGVVVGDAGVVVVVVEMGIVMLIVLDCVLSLEVGVGPMTVVDFEMVVLDGDEGILMGVVVDCVVLEGGFVVV